MKLNCKLASTQSTAQNFPQTASVEVLTNQELQAIAGGKVKGSWAAVGVN